MNRRGFLSLALAPIVAPIAKPILRAATWARLSIPQNPLMTGALGVWKGVILMRDDPVVPELERADWFAMSSPEATKIWSAALAQFVLEDNDDADSEEG